MRQLKCSFTFYNFIVALEKFPEAMERHEKTLLSIRDAMASEFGKSPNEDRLGIVHGELWGGK